MQFFSQVISFISLSGLITIHGQPPPVFTGSPGIKDASEGDNLFPSWTLSQPYGTNGSFKIFKGVPSNPGPDGNYLVSQTAHIICDKHPDVTEDVYCYFSGNNIGFSFNNVKKTDAGNYSCYHQLLSTGEQLFDSAALIYVIGQPTSAVLDPNSPVVEEGRDIDILCQSQSTSEPENYRPDPPLLFTWYRGDVNISDTPPNRHVITGNKLAIEDVIRTDSSFNYSCMSREPGRLQSNRSSTVHINVTYVPGQATAAQDTVDEIFEGTAASLQCSVTDPGNPHWHQYNWTKDGVDIVVTNGASYIIPEGDLTVGGHDGNWTCRAKNSVGAGSPAGIKVIVYASPQVQNPSPDKVTVVAEDVSSLDVLCSIQGKPPPIVTWSLGSSDLPDAVISVDDGSSQSNKLTTVRRRLQWSPGSTLAVRRHTGGSYTCRGTVLTQSDQVALEIDVQYGPFGTSITPAGNITVVENDTVTLTCTANCNPSCGYQWSFGSDDLQADGELTLNSIKRDKEGWYGCTASNGRGQDQQQHIYIAVHYPPDIFITINPSGDLVQGMDVMVLCYADSRPLENNITWTNVTGGDSPYYDDSSNTTHSWITITDIDILDTGDLQCTGNNGVSGSPRSQKRYMEVFGPARVHQTHPANNRSGAGIGDHVSFQVSIIARPIPSPGDWTWMFVPENLTAELAIPGGVELIVNHDLATLTISNVTTEHFGNYSLRTSNSFGGWDTGDVVFELIASGPPSRPTGFHAVRVTAVSITVEWMTGFDGGLPQTFTITYTNIDSGDEGEMSDIPDECPSEGCIMQRKITEDIADEAEYKLQIRADNGRGQAMGDTITVPTPVRASLPKQPQIYLRETEAEITFSVNGQLTDVAIHHCVKDIESKCKEDIFPVINLVRNNQGRGRRQTRDTMYNFAETVDLVDPSASSFVFTVMLYDGDDIIHETESVDIDWPDTVNVGAIVGGVVGGLLLAGLVIALVFLWRKGIIPIDDARPGKSRHQSDRDDQQMVTRNKSGFSNLSFRKERVAESIYEDTESSGILVSKFAAYVDHMLKGQKPFEDEYEDLPQGKQFDWDEASRHDDLKLKNRFRNVLPYDRNRVHLRTLPDDPHSDYINASYIKGYTDEDQMIATLGPMPATIDDFWRMVWEKESPLIVMLTNCIEIGNKKKCEQYWPRSIEDHPLNQGDIQITLTKEDVWPDYTIRTLSVTKNGLKRIVSHCHFTAWPDHGVPDCGTSLIAFRGIVAKKMIPRKYTVVHCSAGVGRTGTLIALDYLIKQAERQNKVDVFSCVEELRMQRIAMVQTSMQYVFIHTALAEYFTTGPTTIPCSDFNKYYLKISKPKKTGPSTTQNQMQMLNKLTPKITDADKDYPLEGVNSSKNRVPEIIPLLCSRVCLTSRIPGCNDYINAVYVNACKKKDAFIVTQVPLDSTIIDFWRLIEDFNSRTVVLLVTDQQYKTMPIFVPSTNNPCVVSNNKMARLTGSIDNFGYTTIKVNIGPVPAAENAYMNFEDVSKPVAPTFEPTSTMKIFIMHIPENKKCPDAKQTISMINDIKTWVVENQPHPITVACWDGAAYSGQFVACCNLMEMMSYEPEVDVYRIVKQIRDRRPQFINNLDQYHGVHHFVLQYLQEFSLYANVI